MQGPALEWHHSSLDTEYNAYKSDWRGAAPVVELVTLRDSEAAVLPAAEAPVEESLVVRPGVYRPLYALALWGQ